MPAIDNQDLEDAKTDTDHIADIATSTAPTATDRFGHVKRTMKGVIDYITSLGEAAIAGVVVASNNAIAAIQAVVAGMGYQVPVAYTSGLSMTTASQTVTYNDGTSTSTYAPIATALPFVTSGTFETTKFRLIQGISAADLAAPTGTSLVGYKPLQSDAVPQTSLAVLREVQLQSSPTAAIPNTGTVARRDCTLLGDSISHGAYALNSFLHCWARIFARCFNAEVGASSYGFTNLLNLGSGPTTTTEIHAVAFGGGGWSGVDNSTNAEATGYPTGQAMRANDGTSEFTITVPTFQSRVAVYYGKRPGGVPFKIYLNGVEAATVTTDGAAGYDVVDLALVDNGYGDNTIRILSSAGAVQVDIIGVAYLSATLEPVFNNFGRSGQRLRYVGEAVISKLMQSSATVIVALAHNDQVDADANTAYYNEFMQRIAWITTYANQNGVRVVVPDFCWAALPSSRTRQALRKLAADTGGIYIDLPSEIFKGRESLNVAQRNTYIVSTLKMWQDQSHPNKAGHQWIAETIAKRMGFTVSSKARALGFHDWWMPFALVVASGAYNYFPESSGLLSGYKRNGNAILVKAYVHKAAGGSFPAGILTLANGWRSKSELVALQGYSGVAVIRQDTGAIVSTMTIASSGQLSLQVQDGTWINQQQLSLTLQA